jgi:hypothetical protein
VPHIFLFLHNQPPTIITPYYTVQLIQFTQNCYITQDTNKPKVFDVEHSLQTRALMTGLCCSTLDNMTQLLWHRCETGLLGCCAPTAPLVSHASRIETWGTEMLSRTTQAGNNILRQVMFYYIPVVAQWINSKLQHRSILFHHPYNSNLLQELVWIEAYKNMTILTMWLSSPVPPAECCDNTLRKGAHVPCLTQYTNIIFQQSLHKIN